ncbi:hypothetical protein ACTXT7_013059 [Hymenolepis weldensis]
MSKRAYPFSPSITASFHLKSTSALMFSRVLAQVAHIKPSLFFHSRQSARLPVAGSYTSLSSPLFLSNPPLSLSLASILVVAALNTFWSNQLLVFCPTIIVSSYSNHYELMTKSLEMNIKRNKVYHVPKYKNNNSNARLKYKERKYNK